MNILKFVSLTTLSSMLVSAQKSHSDHKLGSLLAIKDISNNKLYSKIFQNLQAHGKSNGNNNNDKIRKLRSLGFPKLACDLFTSTFVADEPTSSCACLPSSYQVLCTIPQTCDDYGAAHGCLDEICLEKNVTITFSSNAKYISSIEINVEYKSGTGIINGHRASILGGKCEQFVSIGGLESKCKRCTICNPQGEASMDCSNIQPGVKDVCGGLDAFLDFCPTSPPSQTPSSSPTATPSTEPTATPSTVPTSNPSMKPTSNPSMEPTLIPTTTPTQSPSQNPTVVPTQNPTLEPSKDPSKRPTESPSTEPTFGQSLLIPHPCHPSEQCGECQADCDSDSECYGNLTCYKRNGNEPVPGCSKVKNGLNYCIRPFLTWESANSCTVLNPCSECWGGCISNEDCAGTLECIEEDGYGLFPSCGGSGEVGRKYCGSTDPRFVWRGSDYCVGGVKCGLCEGDCDDDEDCEENLVCFHHERGTGPIPGCAGIPPRRGDICIYPQQNVGGSD